MHHLVAALVVEVIGSQLLVGFASGQPMERTEGHCVGNGYDSAFLAPAAGYALIEGRRIDYMAARRAAEPPMSLPHAPTNNSAPHRLMPGIVSSTLTARTNHNGLVTVSAALGFSSGSSPTTNVLTAAGQD
jgi:hypothetical protein